MSQARGMLTLGTLPECTGTHRFESKPSMNVSSKEYHSKGSIFDSNH